MKAFRLVSCAIVLLLATFAACAPAQQAVTFPSGDATAQGLLYLPHGAGSHPALVVIHEWWGLNDWIKEEAAGYAAKGYVVLAVDLYRGKTADNPETAHELMRGLPQDQGVRDLTSAFTYLQSRKDVNRSRIGAVGWCHGRRLRAATGHRRARPQSCSDQLRSPRHRQGLPGKDPCRDPRQTLAAKTRVSLRRRSMPSRPPCSPSANPSIQDLSRGRTRL